MAKVAKASEVRKLLDLESDARVYDLARQAILPGVVRLGRQVRFNIEKVLEFVEAGGKALPAGWRRVEAAKKPGGGRAESPPWKVSVANARAAAAPGGQE